MAATFFCIDGHTGGMPVRLVVGGAPQLRGATMSDKRQDFLAHHDWIRTCLMFEPRGHAAMSGAILYPPPSDDYDVAVLYIETTGCLPLCGHGTIGTVTFAVERGLVQPREPGVVRLETPAGLVIATYRQQGDKVVAVSLRGVPSFLMHRDLEVELPEFGRLRVDIAYGGNFFAIVEAQPGYPELATRPVAEWQRLGLALLERINATVSVVHPIDPTISGVSHCMWTGAPIHAGSDGRSIVIAAPSLIDRSACGSGTSARVAQRAARGRLRDGEDFVHESVIGSRFTGRIIGQTEVGSYPAVYPGIEGSAWITGFNTFVVDPADPYREGFLL